MKIMGKGIVVAKGNYHSDKTGKDYPSVDIADGTGVFHFDATIEAQNKMENMKQHDLILEVVNYKNSIGLRVADATVCLTK